MTYSLSNNCTTNYYNRTLTVQVIVEDVVTWIFLKHSVVTTTCPDGWLAGWQSHYGIVSKRLNLSENFSESPIILLF